MKLYDIALKNILIQDISKTKSIKITSKNHTDIVGVTYIQKSAKEKDIEKYIFNGSDVTNLKDENANPLFKSLYESIISIEWYETDFKGNPLYKKPDLEIEYNLVNKTTIKIEYVKKNRDYYYAFRDGKYMHLVVDAKMLDSVYFCRKELIKEANRKGINL